MPTQSVFFGPFRLDLANEQLWRGAEVVPLRPKTFAVLRYVVEHPRRLITQEELLREVWCSAAVCPGLLRGYIREVREALGDDADHPRYVATVPRRGYRFVAEVTGGMERFRGERAAPRSIVGRHDEQRALADRLARSLRGERQTVFITGERGIGKTTLLRAFLDDDHAEAPLTATGQCTPQHERQEPFLPALQAIRSLCRAGGKDVTDLFARHAPSWLAQMPGLVDDSALEALRRRAQGALRPFMLREIAEAIEQLSAARPVVLAFEDLQWSDRQTLDLIAMLARRSDPARLMVVATYRSAEGVPPLAAIAEQLNPHVEVTELPLAAFDEATTATFLARRFPDHRFPGELARVIHDCSGGNPWLAVVMIDGLAAQGAIVEAAGTWTLAVPIADVTLVAAARLQSRGWGRGAAGRLTRGAPCPASS